MPKISIVIPVLNQWRFTEQILNDIPLKIKSDYEIIVIDNGSTDETQKKLKEMPHIIVLRYPKNHYVTEAWNV